VVFPVRCISSISPRFYFRRHAFCFHPLATILESPRVLSWWNHPNNPLQKVLALPTVRNLLSWVFVLPSLYMDCLTCYYFRIFVLLFISILFLTITLLVLLVFSPPSSSSSSTSLSASCSPFSSLAFPLSGVCLPFSASYTISFLSFKSLLVVLELGSTADMVGTPVIRYNKWKRKQELGTLTRKLPEPMVEVAEARLPGNNAKIAAQSSQWG
jgi:hypothetical protein